MHAKKSELRMLALRIQEGDSAAADEFLRELEPQLIRIIRSVMRTGVGDSVIACRIIWEIDRMNFAGQLEDDPEWVVKEISGRICQMTIDGLLSGVDEGRFRFETILDCWGVESTRAC